MYISNQYTSSFIRETVRDIDAGTKSALLNIIKDMTDVIDKFDKS